MPIIYLNNSLYNRLVARANQLQIPVNQLATDILSSVDLSRNTAAPQSFQTLYQSLLNSVDAFARSAPDGTEFMLRDVAGWNSTVNQAAYSDGQTVTPNGRRASLGRKFQSDVDNGRVPLVTVAMHYNRAGKLVKKMDCNGVLIYRVNRSGRPPDMN